MKNYTINLITAVNTFIFCLGNLASLNSQCDSIINQSLFPNPKFEELATPGVEPVTFSELFKAADWEQATEATSDYFSVVNYAEYPNRPDITIPAPPNGSDHFVGGAILPGALNDGSDYVEYVGGCLLNGGLIGGQTYSISMLMGSALEVPPTNFALTNTEFVVLGIPDCNFPIAGQECKQDQYEIIGSTTVNIPSNTWLDTPVTIELNPSQDYPGIMFGISCETMPAERRYFLLDDIAVIAGNPCDPDECPPICISQDISVEISSDLTVTIIPEQIDNGSYDECSNVTLEIDRDLFLCDDIGDNTVTLTVTDESGNTSSCETIVNVSDPNNYCNNCENDLTDFSLFPNPKFEELATPGVEPVTFSELFKAADWEQATEATSDYFSVVNYAEYPNRPDITIPAPPNGSDHFVGGAILPGALNDGSDYVEYVGGCLLNGGLIGGQTYSISMLMGSALEVPPTNFALTNTEFVVLGIPDCNFPIAGQECKQDQYEIIGSTTVNIPSNTWLDTPVTIELNPSQDYPGIMFGISCETMPAERRYFLLDDIAVIAGNPCDPDECPPICISQDISVEISSDLTVTIIPEQIDNGSYDECSNVTLEIDRDLFLCDDIGDNTVTLTVTDESGNTSSCETIVNVSDPNNYCNNCENDLTDFSLFPNPKFEELATPGVEPVTFSELFKAADWEQATEATSDYFSVVNYAEYPNRPDITIPAPPNGSDHFVGGAILPGALNDGSDYVEYVGGCLLNGGLIGGQTYSISMLMGSALEVPPTNFALTNTEFVVLGIPDCNFPIAGQECKQDQYEIIGSTTVNIPSNTWLDTPVTIELNPSQDYPGIMFGISCETMPAERRYFLLDDIAVIAGNPCDPDECPPICISQDISVEISSDLTVTIIPEQIDNGSYDECSNVTLEIDRDLFLCDDIGDNTVTLTVTDESGNTSSCEAIVNVSDPNNYCTDPCCASSEELSHAVETGFSSANVLCPDDDGISLTVPRLLMCQSVHRVIWGDGTVDIIENDVIPTHYYESNGAYLISMEIAAISENGDTCQIDVADITIVYKNCTVGTEFTTQDKPLLKLYPIPTSGLLNIELNLNNHGYNALVVNSIGQTVNEFEVINSQLLYSYDTSLLQTGVYYLIMKSLNGNEVLEARFIKF